MPIGPLLFVAAGASHEAGWLHRHVAYFIEQLEAWANGPCIDFLKLAIATALVPCLRWAHGSKASGVTNSITESSSAGTKVSCQQWSRHPSPSLPDRRLSADARPGAMVASPLSTVARHWARGACSQILRAGLLKQLR